MVEMPPIDRHVIHPKWVEDDADGKIGRYKARLVACETELLFGVEYGLTFVAVMGLRTVKVLPRK